MHTTATSALPLIEVKPTAITVPTVRLILRDFIGYLKNPVYERVTSPIQNEKPVRKAWLLFRVNFLLILSAALVGISFMKYVTALTGVSLQQKHTIDSWGLVLIVFTLIPLVEETIFRLLLRPTVTRMWWMGLGLGTVVSVQIYFRSSGDLRYLLLGLAWIGIVLVVTLVVSYKSALKDWLQSYFRWLFYASAIVFGLSHLTNCNELTVWHWLLVPVITLPQLVLGFFNGYVRMTYGFWYAVAMHSMLNAFPALIAAIE